MNNKKEMKDMPTVSGITRTDVDSLIETQVANEIFEGTVRQSKALSMFRRLPNMTSDKTTTKNFLISLLLLFLNLGNKSPAVRICD